MAGLMAESTLPVSNLAESKREEAYSLIEAHEVGYSHTITLAKFEAGIQRVPIGRVNGVIQIRASYNKTSGTVTAVDLEARAYGGTWVQLASLVDGTPSVIDISDYAYTDFRWGINVSAVSVINLALITDGNPNPV